MKFQVFKMRINKKIYKVSKVINKIKILLKT